LEEKREPRRTSGTRKVWTSDGEGRLEGDHARSTNKRLGDGRAIKKSGRVKNLEKQNHGVGRTGKKWTGPSLPRLKKDEEGGHLYGDWTRFTLLEVLLSLTQEEEKKKKKKTGEHMK